MLYFNHDTNASRSEELTALRVTCGGAAVDAYWMLVELIHERETELVLFDNQSLTKSVCHWLNTDEDTLFGWVTEMQNIGLFTEPEPGTIEGNGVILHSGRAIDNILEYVKKSETARRNGSKGGRKPTANQTLTNSVPSAKLSKSKSKSKSKDISSSNEEDIVEQIPYDEIVGYLNEQTGSSFKPEAKETRRLIKARWNDGFRLPDFKHVIDIKVSKWGRDPKMVDYLRPQTLFSTKFESYLNEKPATGGAEDDHRFDAYDF